jgi:periplasmic copper chaperone A
MQSLTKICVFLFVFSPTFAAQALAVQPTKLASANDAVSNVAVSHAWIRLPPPGGHMAALYFEATNSSSADEAIDDVTVHGAGSAHLHETFIDAKGMTRMRSASNVKIPAQKSLTLSPGGLHVMLHGLSGVKPGATVQASLSLKSGKLIKFTAETRGAAD